MHYTPDGRGNVLNIVVHQKVRLSGVNVTKVLDSDHVLMMRRIALWIMLVLGTFWSHLKNLQTGSSLKPSL
jgi:hypothetical protein